MSSPLALPESVEVLSPLTLVLQAIERGLDGQQLNSLMDFAERYQANQAKTAFTRAFAAFKQQVPVILKTGKIIVDQTVRGTFAPLDEVCDKLIPALSSFGLSHRWVTKDTPEQITVTCRLRHEGGYEEEGATLSGPPDTSGGKNAIQARCSTVSYLERYTLMASCGVAAKEEDKAAAPQGGSMGEQIEADWVAKIEESATVEELKANFTAALKAAKEHGDRRAAQTFQHAKVRCWQQKGFHA